MSGHESVYTVRQSEVGGKNIDFNYFLAEIDLKLESADDSTRLPETKPGFPEYTSAVFDSSSKDSRHSLCLSPFQAEPVSETQKIEYTCLPSASAPTNSTESSNSPVLPVALSPVEPLIIQETSANQVATTSGHRQQPCKTAFKTRAEITRYKFNENTFQCQLCSSKCKTEDSLASHMVMHRANRVWPCLYCVAAFKSADERLTHERLVHSSKKSPSTINQYAKFLQNSKTRSSTLIERNPPEEFQINRTASLRHDALPQEEQEQSHVSNNSNVTTTTGLLSVGTFSEIPDTNDASGHQSQSQTNGINTETEPFQGGRILNDSVSNTSQLQPPSAPTWKQHRCKICAKVLRTPESLKRHVSTHTNDIKLLQCSYCPRKLKSSNGLSRHQLILHSDLLPSDVSDTIFKCDWCPKSCPDQSTLMAHTRIHTGEKPFNCGFCSKTFSMDWNKRSHEKRMHGGLSDPKTQTEKLRCGICERLCKSKHLFEIHMKVHAGEKPFQCQYCPDTFTSRSNTTLHGQRMHPDKFGGIQIAHKYRCRWCGKRYYNLQLLRLHEINHTGERPFGCEICKMSFSQQRILRKHLKTMSHKYQLLLLETASDNTPSNISAHIAPPDQSSW